MYCDPIRQSVLHTRCSRANVLPPHVNILQGMYVIRSWTRPHPYHCNMGVVLGVEQKAKLAQ